jgi:hypothetical protein
MPQPSQHKDCTGLAREHDNGPDTKSHVVKLSRAVPTARPAYIPEYSRINHARAPTIGWQRQAAVEFQ